MICITLWKDLFCLFLVLSFRELYTLDIKTTLKRCESGWKYLNASEIRLYEGFSL